MEPPVVIIGLVFKADEISNLVWDWHYSWNRRKHAEHYVSLRDTFRGSIAADLEWKSVPQGRKNHFGSSAWPVRAEKIHRFQNRYTSRRCNDETDEELETTRNSLLISFD